MWYTLFNIIGEIKNFLLLLLYYWAEILWNLKKFC